MTKLKPQIYIGVDPGKVTGVASYTVRDLMHSVGEPIQMIEKVRELIGAWGATPIILAVERYTMGGTVRTQQPEALEIIGVMRWFAHVYPNVTMVLQGAADASLAGSRENLTKVGWWIKGDPDQHRNKAAAQVALAMITHDPAMWYMLLAGVTIKT